MSSFDYADCRLMGRGLLATTAMGLLFISAAPVMAADAKSDTIDLPTLAVEGKDSGYKTNYSASEKFTAPLLDTPKTVTVIPKEVIQQSGATSLTDALRLTPGITLGMGEGGIPFGDRTLIRGFSAESDTFIDGVRDPGSQSREIFDIEQIEVVKGPGSAYTGAGSTGGSINLISKHPKAETFYAGTVTFGTDKTKRVTGDANYVICDDIAIRINAMYHDADVAGRDAVTVNRWGFAPSVTFGLNSPTRVTADYYHLQTDDIPDYGIPYARVKSGATTVQTGEPAVVNLDNFYGMVYRDFRKTKVDTGTLKVEHDFNDNLKFSNIIRYSVSSNDYVVSNPDDSVGNVVNGYVYRSIKSRNSENKYLVNQSSLNGVFNTGSVEHSFATGFEISRQEVTGVPQGQQPYIVTQVPSALTPTGVPAYLGNNRNCVAATLASHDCTSLYTPNPYDSWGGTLQKNVAQTTTTTNTWSLYAFDTLKFTEQLSLNLGLRYDNYRQSAVTPTFINMAGTGTTAANTVLPGTVVTTPTLQNDSDFLNYQIGFVYKPLPNGSVYVSYATSSNPSGETGGDGGANISGTATGNQNLEPEKNRSFELGTKWDVFHERLSLTAAIFRTEKTNARVADATGVLQLVGDQRINGFEFGAAGAITDDWSVFGGYTFLDSEVTGGGPLGTNVGNEFPNVPRQSFSVWTSYRILPEVIIGGGANYMSKVFGNAANTLWVPSYWRFDAMASYAITKNVTLQVNIQNLTDKRYFDRAYTTHMATVAPGRAALFTALAKF